MKQQLRKSMLKQRSTLLKCEEKSLQIAKHFLMSPFLKNVNTIMLYRSVHSEVRTDFLWKQLKQMGKICLFPKCISKTEMIAVLAQTKEDFLVSDKKIPEPVSSLEYPKENIDLIVVPGVSFDASKYRLGYGCGFYDRYLKGYCGITVGVSYHEQLCDCVFPNEWDIPVNYLITQNGIF